MRKGRIKRQPFPRHRTERAVYEHAVHARVSHFFGGSREGREGRQFLEAASRAREWRGRCNRGFNSGSSTRTRARARDIRDQLHLSGGADLLILPINAER